jgi:hypothetical protein
MGNSKLGKFRESSVSSVSKESEGACGTGRRAEHMAPNRVEKGIHEYVRLAGMVYSVYRTTTHKYLGVALYNGSSFEPCDIQTLITALESEGR